MVTPRILREVEREIPEMGGGRVAVSFLFLTNLNEPPRALAASTIAWVMSQLHPLSAVVNKSNAR